MRTGYALKIKVSASRNRNADQIRYDGDIDGFINGTRAVTQNKINTIHILAPADITIEGSKALSESFCEITSRFEHGGYEFDKVTTCRLISTLEKLDLNAFEKKSASRNPWKILTLEPIYIRDSIVPANPSFIEKPPRFEGLEKFPKSYCHGAWLLDKIQITSRLDLPSEDNHEAVKAIFDRHHKWLYSA